jgi:hypothetical protein
VFGVLLLVPTAAIAAQGFTDVPDSHVFYEDIDWLTEAGVTFGCEAGAYCPDDPITRGEAAAMFHRLAVNRVVDAATVDGMDAADLEGRRGRRGDQGPQGPAGPSGPAGPQGPPGVLGFYTVASSPVSVPGAGSVGSAAATCDPGDSVTGGGFETVGAAIFFADVSAPTGTDTWTVTGKNFAGTAIDLIAHAVCADETP